MKVSNCAAQEAETYRVQLSEAKLLHLSARSQLTFRQIGLIYTRLNHWLHLCVPPKKAAYFPHLSFCIHSHSDSSLKDPDLLRTTAMTHLHTATTIVIPIDSWYLFQPYTSKSSNNSTGYILLIVSINMWTSLKIRCLEKGKKKVLFEKSGILPEPFIYINCKEWNKKRLFSWFESTIISSISKKTEGM